MIKKNTGAKVLVLGLGNTIKGDDGIGIFVAENLKKFLLPTEFDVICTDRAGFSWLDLLCGYKRVIIIDAIKTKKDKIGRVSKLNLNDCKLLKHIDSSHQLGFTTVLDLGNKLGVCFPEEIEIYAIGIEGGDDFCDTFSSSISKIKGSILKQVKTAIIGRKREDD